MDLGGLRVVGEAKRFTFPRDPYIINPWIDKSYVTGKFTPSLSDPNRPTDTPLKYQRVLGSFDGALLSRIENYIIHKLQMAGVKIHSRSSFLDVLPYVEVGSSPGYPLVFQWRTKRDLLQDPAAYALLEKDFMDIKRTNGCYSDFPKGDEILRAGKRSREICGSEFGVGLKQMSVSIDFNHAIENNRSLPVMLGISPVYGGWMWFATKQLLGNEEIALDASNFDASVAPELYRSVVNIRKAFLNAEHHDLLDRLYQNVLRKNIIDLDGVIFETDGGTPSGQVSTAHDNSLISWILWLYFVVVTYGTFAAADDFECSFYGDDVHIVYKTSAMYRKPSKDELMWWYSGAGFVLKSEGWCPRFGADFLSRKTKLYRGTLIPVSTRSQKLFESLNYVLSSSWQPYDVLARACQLRTELFGTEYFDLATKRIQKELIDRFGPLFRNHTKWREAILMFDTEDEIFDFISGRQLA